MSGLQVAIALGAVATVALVVLGLGASRIHTLTRRVGSFECAYSRASDPDAPWVAGVGQYGAGSLYWWRWWSLRPRPQSTWQRSRMQVLERAAVDDARGFESQVVVRCCDDNGTFDLLMSAEAYAGLASWLEASPPTGEHAM